MRRILAVLLIACVALGVAVSARAADEAAAQPAAGKHILAVKGDAAYYCTCGAGCKCTLEGEDMTKCSCGKPVEKVNIKGKYVCENCCTIADTPGKCEKCGMELKKVE